MHDPLPDTHSKRVILSYLQIVHHLRAWHNLVAGDHAIPPIRAQHMHSQFELTHWHKALLFGKEGVFLVGVDDFVGSGCYRAMGRVQLRRQREIDEIVIGVNPDVQDGFVFHLARLGIVGQHLFATLSASSSRMFEGFLPDDLKLMLRYLIRRG